MIFWNNNYPDESTDGFVSRAFLLMHQRQCYWVDCRVVSWAPPSSGVLPLESLQVMEQRQRRLCDAPCSQPEDPCLPHTLSFLWSQSPKRPCSASSARSFVALLCLEPNREL